MSGGRNVIPPEVVNDINELLNTLNNVNANTDDVEAKLDDVISELQDIEIDVESVNLNTDEVEAKLDSTISELQDIDANTDTVESELQDINSELDTIQLNTDGLETKLDTTISELQDIDANTDTVESELQDINTELDNIEINTEDIETELQDIESDVETVNTTLDTPRQEDGHGSTEANPSFTDLESIGGEPQSAVDIANKIELITDNLPQGGEHLKTRCYGVQPDGDLVGDQADGQVDFFEGQLQPDEEVTVNGFTNSDGWSAIEVFVSADEPSALQGVEVDYTDDAQGDQNVRATRTKTFTGEAVDKGFETFKFETDLDGFRVRYTNNGDAVSNILLVVSLRLDPAADSANYVGKNTLGDNFVRVGTSEASDGLKIGEPTSLFGDMETIERRTLLDVSSSFGTSVLRDETDSTGSGVIAEDPNDNGEIETSTGTTADSSIDLRTAAYGRYTPGYSAQAGMGIRPIGLPWNEGEARWGYFGDTGQGSGFYFGYDASQDELFIAVIDRGTEKVRVYKSNWNGQDFESVFDKPFEPTDAYIYQIDFAWYGYGIVNFKIAAQTSDTISGRTPRQETITVHSVTINEDTTIPDPNEPIRIEVENGTNGDDNRLAVGGRQFSIFGKESRESRITSDTRFDATVNNGAWTYVMSWQRGEVVGDANARLDFSDMDFSIDQTCKLALVLNADVTGTDYILPTLTPQNETLLEVSKTGTFNEIGTGRKVWEGSIFVGGQGNASASIDVDAKVNFGQNGELTLIAQPQGGDGDATTTMRLEEDW